MRCPKSEFPFGIIVFDKHGLIVNLIQGNCKSSPVYDSCMLIINISQWPIFNCLHFSGSAGRTGLCPGEPWQKKEPRPRGGGGLRGGGAPLGGQWSGGRSPGHQPVLCRAHPAQQPGRRLLGVVTRRGRDFFSELYNVISYIYIAFVIIMAAKFINEIL